MKKLYLLLLALILVINVSACKVISKNPDPSGSSQEPSQSQTNKPEKSILDGSLEEILEKIYETAEVDANFKDYIENGLQTSEITPDNTAYFLGKEGIEFESAIASEPIMMPSAYSLCLVRVKEGADIEKIKTDIKENADPQKWVCVGVDPQNVIVDNIDDVIILIMSNDHAQALHEAFLALEG